MTFKEGHLLEEAKSVVRKRLKEIQKKKNQKSAVISSVQTGKQKCISRRTIWKALVSVSWKTLLLKIIKRIFFNSFGALLSRP